MYSDGLLKLPIFTIQKNFKILLTVYSLSPHTSINFSYIQKGCSNRYSPVVAAELSLLHVTVLDSGFATLRFHKCALMVNNFIEFAHFCQYIFFIHTKLLHSTPCNMPLCLFLICIASLLLEYSDNTNLHPLIHHLKHLPHCLHIQ